MVMEAYITPGVLRWARERDRLTPEAAAQRINVDVDRIRAWETGTARPTFRQAQSLAQKFNIPFGYLFLSAPPHDELPLPDLRTVADETVHQPSPELIDVVSDALAKQTWYREYQEAEHEASVPFIGRYSIADGVETIAADIRTTLGLTDEMRKQATSWEDFLRAFIAKVEDARVMVLRNSVVGHNTHRKLDVREFRGFAISDHLAPLIFINSRDAKSAQIFTLAHELAHLWIGQSGISNPDYGKAGNQQGNVTERLTNRIATETLLPNADFLAAWNKAETVEANLQLLTSRFRVSQIVVLRQAFDLSVVTTAVFRRIYSDLLKRQQEAQAAGEGGDFYRIFLARSGRRLTSTLLSALAEDRVSYKEAAQLLGVKIGTLERISPRLSEYVG
jgi:Zn-dependent peptidase ImmA (M78 family)/transcriptional regulator with XRE-family HTH domain